MPGFVPGRSRNSSMQPIFEEIWFRFGEAEKEAKLLALALAYFKRRASAESAPEWKYLAIGGIASGMEKVYSGVEKTLQIIANDLDGPPPISGEGWHRRLLDRMALVVEGRRPAVLTQPSVEKLEVLLGFRHRERNTYTAGLAEGRMLEIAGGITDAMNAVRADLTRFERAMAATSGETQRPEK